jgi:hypothetical protein
MSEYFNFGDDFNMNLYSLNFLGENFTIISPSIHHYHWLAFFNKLEHRSIDYDIAKQCLIKTLAKLQYTDILDENITQIWNYSPSFFSNGYIANNFDYLEKDDRFLRLLRQIKIDRIIV